MISEVDGEHNRPQRPSQRASRGLLKVEEVLATLEELTNREGLERIRKAEEEYKKGEYTTLNIGNLSPLSAKYRKRHIMSESGEALKGGEPSS